MQNLWAVATFLNMKEGAKSSHIVHISGSPSLFILLTENFGLLWFWDPSFL
jgi:hypothetical protein